MSFDLSSKIHNLSQPVIDTFKSGVELFKKQTTPVQIAVGAVAGVAILAVTTVFGLLIAKLACGRVKKIQVDPAVEKNRKENVETAEAKFENCKALKAQLEGLEAEARKAVEDANAIIAQDAVGATDDVKLQIAKAKNEIRGLEVISKEATEELEAQTELYNAADAASGALADAKAKYFEDNIKPAAKKLATKKLTDAISQANKANEDLHSALTPLVNARNEFKLNKELLANLQAAANTAKDQKVTAAENKVAGLENKYTLARAALLDAETNLEDIVAKGTDANRLADEIQRIKAFLIANPII